MLPFSFHFALVWAKNARYFSLEMIQLIDVQGCVASLYYDVDDMVDEDLIDE